MALTEYWPCKEIYPNDLYGLERFSKKEQEQIRSALQFAKRFHGDQRRVAGPKFITHPIAVAQLLIDFFEADADTVIAGLLHDTVEDTPATLEDVETLYGARARFIVDGATEVGRGDGQDRIFDKEERKKASRKKVREYGKQDKSVLTVKIADRWHNTCSCHALRAKNQRLMAEEFLSFHIPIAKELGYDTTMMENAAQAVLERVTHSRH